MSSINQVLFPNGYQVSSIQKIDLQVGAAANPHTYGSTLSRLGDEVTFHSVDHDAKHTLSSLTFPDREIYDGTFSEEDAVMAVWQERYGKIRIDFETGQVYTSKEFSVIPKEGQLDAIRQELQAGGASDILWSEYAKIAGHLSFSSSGYSPGELAPSLDMLSAAYAAQKHLLQEKFTGGELAEQMNYLEQTHQKYVEQMLGAYSEKAGGFLDENGSSGQTEKVRESLRTLVDEHIGKYEKLLAGDPTGTAGTENSWLGSHLSYLTQSLLQIGKSTGTGAAEEGGRYTLRELEVINATASAYEKEISDARQQGGGDEVRAALELALIDMKQETLAKMSGIGEELKEILETARAMARDKVLDAQDEYFARRRETLNTKGEKASWFPPVDRELFTTVYQLAMDAFHRTGDALRSIRDGAAQAKPLLGAAVSDRESAQRWRTSIAPYGYWDTFYGSDVPYGGQKSGYQQFVNSWQEFLNTIPSVAGPQ